MKKILFLFGALALIITSCSSNDDDSGKNEVVILPKTIKFSEPDYPLENTTSIITYDGNKIVSSIDEETKTIFTYEGNVIVKSIEYEITGDKREEQSFSYTNGKLTSTLYARKFTSQYPFGQYKGRYVYTYNPDGTVKREVYSINPTTGIESKNDYLEVYTFQNGNLVKMVATDQPSGVSSVRTSLYEYDIKNSPFKNVLGYNLLIDADNSSVNNLTKHTYTYSGDNSSYSRKTVYEYNDKGYPTKETLYGQDGVTVDAIHEYTY
ncbi:hypothetical protein [Flavobacterium denitrificans]|uniref:hypothetical protein n=1 Tax=Flavobacterium denitrificans TaxID=281361 RepID=UPI000423B18E|nr:hypothetical protein [Flavobacterium denitrificans]